MSSNRLRRFKRLGAALAVGALAVGFAPVAALTGVAAASAPTPAAVDTSAFCANVPPDNPFTDLPSTDAHFDNVLCLAFAGITQGTTATTYSPTNPVRRDQMASFIARFLDLAITLESTPGTLTPLPASGPDAFTDDTGDTHEANINRLAAAGIVNGTTATTYSPAAPVRRDQMASFINRAEEFLTGTALTSSTDFFDDDNGDVHEDNINALAEAGIVQGTGGGLYNPAGSVLRDQMGSFIIRKAAFDNAAGLIDILPPAAGTDDITVDPSPAPAVLFASTNSADPAGKRHFDVHVNTSTITGPVDVFLISSSGPNLDPSTFKPRFEDDNNDLRADAVNPTLSNSLQAKIVAINGVNPVGGATGYVDNQAVPSDGNFSVDIQLVGPINLGQAVPGVFLGVMRDGNNDNRLSVDADRKATEPVALGGFTAWTSPVPANVSSFTNTVIFGGFPFTLFNLLTTQTGPTDPANTQNTRFPYDSNDIFRINGVQVTMDQFNKGLNAFDTIQINFNNDPAGVSEFNITNDIGQAAPTDLTVAVLNLDAGATANDVRGTFTTNPFNQSGVVYHVQRASTAGADGLCGTADDGLPSLSFADVATVQLNTLIGEDPGDQLTFTLLNNPDGCFAFRIQVINTATSNVANGNQVGTAGAPVLVPAPNDVTAPRIMTGAGKDIGNPGTVDTGDKVTLLFDETMNLAAGDIVRFKDFAGEFRNVTLGTGNTFVATTRGGQTALVITFSAALTAEGDADGNAANNDGLIEWNGLTIDATTGVTDLNSNELNLATSDAAINIDTTAPGIATATGTVGFNQVIVVFDEAFDPTTAADGSKYKINNGGGITNDPVTNALPSGSAAPSAITGTNGEAIAKAWVQVTLNVQFPLQAGSTMTHAVADLLGNAGNITGTPVAIATNTGILATCSAPCQTTEAGGTKTISYSLAQQPTGTVTLAIASDDTTEGTVAPASLVFTAANFATPQNVTVTGVNDNLVDGDVVYHVTATATSADPNFNGATSSTAVTNLDNDTAGFNIVGAPTQVTELPGPGHTDTFSVALTSQPSTTVNVQITSGSSADYSVSPSVLTFTPANFSTPQNVTVTAIDDSACEADPELANTSVVALPGAAEYTGASTNVQNQTSDPEDVCGSPTIVQAAIVLGGNTINLTYDETVNCRGGNVQVADNFGYATTAPNDPGARTGTNITQNGANGCTLTLSGAAFSSESAGDLTYTGENSYPCQPSPPNSGCPNDVVDTDPDFNVAANETVQASKLNGPSINGAPTVSAAGDTVSVVFDQPILCSTLDDTAPRDSDFVVTVNGQNVAITALAGCSSPNDNDVTLTVNRDILAGDSIDFTSIAGGLSDNRGDTNNAQVFNNIIAA